MEVKITAQGVTLSDELQALIKVVDTGPMAMIDILSDMKVAPGDTVFMMDTQRAVFLVNNADMFDLTFCILHPEEDPIDVFNAAWIGMEKFNKMIKEVEMINATKPVEEEEQQEAPLRFGHQYARVDRKGGVKPIVGPIRGADEADESEEEA